MDAGLIDRSRFLDREVLDPHRVMETSRMGGASASAMAAGVGQHSGGNLDFLKQAVDLGVRKLPRGLTPGARALADALLSARCSANARANRRAMASHLHDTKHRPEADHFWPALVCAASQTSIMAVAYDGGVVIGADSRTSTGIYISNRVSDKITKIDDRIFVCRSGSAADTQAISDYVTHFINQHKMEFGKPPSVKTAANFFRQLCYTNKEALMAGILVAGWDEKEGGQVYCIPVGGALVQQPFSIGGSGSTYIYGFCDAYYKPGMTAMQCEEFVKKALSHAMARDGSSGGVIRTVRIDAAGAEKKFVAGDKLPFGPL